MLRLLTWMLLVLPGDLPCWVDRLPCQSALVSALRDVSLALEVADPKETWGQWPSEIRCCRQRHQCLRDAPPAADGCRLPAWEYAAEQYGFACGYRAIRQGQRECWPGMPDDGLDETVEWLALVWCEIQYAAGGRGVFEKRMALKRLRDTIGPDLYRSGRYPPCVPLGAFRRID